MTTTGKKRMNEHGSAGPLSNAVGFCFGLLTIFFDFLGNNAAGITCFFMIISVVGGLYISWDRNRIIRSQGDSK